jgi:hypothetical protein
MSLYTTVVFVIGQLIRSQVINRIGQDVIWTDMPDVDLVVSLCLDIYLVREMKDFLLEEELFSKLLFLYRSPETLISFTRLRYLIPVEMDHKVDYTI